MKRRLFSLAALGLLGLAAYSLFTPKGDEAASTPAHSQDAPAPRALKALRLSSQPVAQRIELSGRTSAFKIAEIRPQVGGIITERFFKEGGSVRERQQLYQIDPAPYQAAYNSAKADEQKAQAALASIEARSKRYKELVKIDAVSHQDYEDIKAMLAQAKADIAIAKAAVAQAKINLDYTKVYAPIAGIISKSNITKGALVTAGQAQALATITALDPIYVDMTQSSDDAMQLRLNNKDYSAIPVTLTLGNSSTPYAHEGKLQFHEVSVDPTTGSVLLRAQFPNPDKLLLPGLFVRAHLILQQSEALLVPQSAAQRQPDGSLSVWRLSADGKAESASLTTSGTSGSSWIVASGLNAGDVIITEGLITLAAGTPVTPVFEDNTPESAPAPAASADAAGG